MYKKQKTELEKLMDRHKTGMNIEVRIDSEEIKTTQNTIMDIYCELFRIRKLLEELVTNQEGERK